MNAIYPLTASLILIILSSGCVTTENEPTGDLVSGLISKDIDTITYSVSVPETIFRSGTTKPSLDPYHSYTIPGETFPSQHTFQIAVWKNTRTIEETIDTQSLGMGESEKVKRIVFKGKDAVWEDASIQQFKSTWILFPNNCGRYINFKCNEPYDSTINFCDSIFDSLDFECK